MATRRTLTITGIRTIMPTRIIITMITSIRTTMIMAITIIMVVLWIIGGGVIIHMAVIIIGLGGHDCLLSGLG